MRINFNSFSLGLGGGNRFIFELSNALIAKGHEVTITHAGLSSLHDWFTPINAKLNECNISLFERALNKYGIKRIDVHKAQHNRMIKAIPDCDINVATYYDTVVPTIASQKGEVFYLVQHFEPSFFPEGSIHYLEAEQTYHMPIKKLCVSQWLTEKVNGQFIGNGINPNKFYDLHKQRPYDVMVIPRPSVAWKGDYMPLIFNLNKKLKVLVAQNFTDTEMLEAYNSSKVFLYLSDREGFGYPPIEAMACGAAVVSTNCTEYFEDNKNALLLPDNYTLSTIYDRIDYLLNTDSYRNNLVAQGHETASRYLLSRVVDNFVKVIKEN